MNTRKPRMYVLMAVGLVLALLMGSIPGIKAMAQDVTPAADPIPTFTDVAVSHWAYNYIEILYNAGVTSGCSTSPLKYCPSNEVTRAQMAVFLLKAEHGSDYVPPAGSGTLFSDVPADYWAVDWIEQLAAEDITTGCAVGMYCPQNGVTRAQMAVFLLKGKYGSDYVPPAASGTLFSDVPGAYWAANWIEQLASEGITTGCAVGMYCPQTVVTRAQMAVFLVKAFGLVDPRGVAAEDFGVVNGPEVIGYNVGWHLVDAVVSDTTSIVVKLYNGTTELATATATAKVFTDFPDAIQLSAPFDVLGTFNYTADGYWTYSGWLGYTSVIPDKAEITVTFKNGLVKTATNTMLSGDTSIFTKGDVVAQDFGVMDFSGVKGYTVGFGLVDAVASDMTGVVVKLYNGTTELATATATGLMANYPTLTSLSAPFDVAGTFDYEADGNWSYSGWLADKIVLPDKAEITVTFKNGLVKTATNTMLTGDISIFAPVLTKPATDITPADGRLNAFTGPDDVAGRTFWVSASPFEIPEAHYPRPAGVFATIDKGALAAYTPYSIMLSTVTDLLPITPNTTYYYVAWVKIDGVWYHGEVLSFTTLP